MGAFPDPAEFGFVAPLEVQFEELLAELKQLRDEEFVDAPDSLSLAKDGYDEVDWDPAARLIWAESLTQDNTLLCRLVVDGQG